MISEYVCPLCNFIFAATTTYKQYKCPSCATFVQAIPLNRAEHEVQKPKFDPEERTPDGFIPQ